MKFDKFCEQVGLEWTYLLISPQYPWHAKCGRSTKFDARLRDISATMSSQSGRRVDVYPFLKLPMFWAGKAEKVIHNWVLWTTAKNMPGSGFTEWSYFLNFYSAALVYLCCVALGFDCPQYPAIIIIFSPLPLDFAVLLITLAGIQYGFVGLIFYSLWHIFF